MPTLEKSWLAPDGAMLTRVYRIRGVVQGVGFRPFIHRLAREHHLCGWVLNAIAGVLIHARGFTDRLRQFVEAIERRAPPAPVIASIDATDIVASETFDALSVRESVNKGTGDTLVPPDLSICCKCDAELIDPADRPYRYPFISCTNCGPGYSIIGDMPMTGPPLRWLPSRCARTERRNTATSAPGGDDGRAEWRRLHERLCAGQCHRRAAGQAARSSLAQQGAVERWRTVTWRRRRG